MSRRRFVVALGYSGWALVAPSFAMAQRASGVRHIGFLTLSSIESDPRPERFREGLRELGYVEGKSIAIEWRSAQGNVDRLAGLAADLLQLKVELIVASQTQAIQAAARGTSLVPIVFLLTHD